MQVKNNKGSLFTSGSIRYHAVATGDHFACTLPMPFTACASSSIT